MQKRWVKIRTTIRNCFVFALVFVAFNAFSDQLVHKFGSPSFNAQNQSAHYLTIDEQERTRAEKAASDDPLCPDDWQNRYGGLIWK